MDPKVIDLLTQVADKLNTTAYRLWPEIVQTYWTMALVWLVADVIMLIVGLTVAFFVGKATFQYHKVQQDRHDAAVSLANNYVSSFDYETTGWDIVAGFVIATALFATGAAFVGITSCITFLLNPEGATVLRLLGKF